MVKEFETKCNDLKDFNSGAKRDNPAGKGAYELISPLAVKRLAKLYERGASQKGARNWENGFPMSRCMQSALRHTFQHLEGMRDEDHLAQACWNLFCCMHFEEMIERGKLPKEINDLPDFTASEKEMQSNHADLSKFNFKKMYLAHPFDERKKVRKWELGFEKKTGIELVNPFYDAAERTDIEKCDAGRQERYDQVNPAEIVERDIKYITQCEAVIGIITGALSYGTIQELVYARINKKPVFLIITNGHKNHPWLRYHSDKIFSSVKDFENYAENTNNGNRQGDNNK